MNILTFDTEERFSGKTYTVGLDWKYKQFDELLDSMQPADALIDWSNQLTIQL